MAPPFQITAQVLATISRVDRALGRLSGLSVSAPQPLLRKRNHVRTIQASAAIEGNPLSVDQVTAMLAGKRVLGREQHVLEILNVNEAYGRLPQWVATSRKSLLEAHGVLMKGLVPDAGRLRTSGVGVFRGERLTHLAPPAHLVSRHLDELFRWLRRGTTSALIAGCVVHYELLFVHPFLDGNGRVARLWQQVVHRAYSPLLQFVPVESIIRQRQSRYYELLRQSDAAGDCTKFLEFALGAVADALEEFGREVRPERQTSSQRIEETRRALGRRWFARADYLRVHVRLSSATASRDLSAAVNAGTLKMRGDKRMAEYRFTR